MHHSRDILELLVQRRVFVGQSVVIELIRKFLADTGGPPTDLVSNELDILLSCLELLQVRL